jgi:type IV pilus assembly protein PilO
MALLPDDPKNQYRLLGIILIVALGGLYFLYFHRPKGEDLFDLEARVEQIEQQNELAEARMENLDAVRQELELGERQFAMLERLVPAEGEVPAIYEAIASESQSLGLELISVTPAQPSADTTGYFMHQNWQMEVEGEYHDVGEFLARVASFSRIVRPDIQEVRPTRETNSGRQLVSARFALETFVLPPDAGREGEMDGN